MAKTLCYNYWLLHGSINGKRREKKIHTVKNWVKWGEKKEITANPESQFAFNVKEALLSQGGSFQGF